MPSRRELKTKKIAEEFWEWWTGPKHADKPKRSEDVKAYIESALQTYGQSIVDEMVEVAVGGCFCNPTYRDRDMHEPVCSSLEIAQAIEKLGEK